MSKVFITEKDFKGIDFSKESLEKGEYEYCSFTNCNFSKASLSDISFVDCVFDNCDISTAKVGNTAFRDVRFKECKMLGVHFEDCNKFLFSVDFRSCILDLSSFYKMAMKNSKFVDCHLKEVDFTGAEMTGSAFQNCDFARATFSDTILEKSDFRSSYNYSIDPENNRIKKAKFSLQEVAGLLDKYSIVIE